MSAQTPEGTSSFCWFELATSDHDAAEKFYGALFDWDLRRDELPHGMSYTQCFDHGAKKEEGQGIAAMFGMGEEMQKRMPPCWNVYVQVTSADDTAREVEALGGKVLNAPFDVMEFGRMAVLMDPQGAVFQVWQPKLHSGTSLDYRMPGRVCWVELMTRGSKNAQEFYGKAFAWDFPKKGDGESSAKGETYQQYFHGGAPMGGFMEMDGQAHFDNIPPHWMVYFAVSDVDASAQKVIDLGGSILLPPHDLPGVGRHAVAKDPQGATFSLFRLNDDH